MTDNKEREALKVIAEWPVTHPTANMDAANMRDVARAALAASQEKAEPVELEYATSLAVHLHQRYYVAEAPDWKPFNDLRGVLSQIDNMISGLPAPVAAQAAHPDDAAVDRFAAAMKEKLAAARERGRSVWENVDPAELSLMLHQHVEKGDPSDVANFCMVLWTLGERIGDSVLPYGKRAVAPQPSAEAVRDAALEEAANTATGFLVGDPLAGIPLRNPMTHEIAAAIRALKSAPPQPAEQPSASMWVSVNDRLPKFDCNERVLVYTDGTDFAGEQFFDIKSVDLYPTPDGKEDTRSEVAAAVTHWMERPFPCSATTTWSASPAALFESGYALTDEEITKLAESMPGGLEGFLKGWGWQNFARAVESEVMLAIARAQGEQA